MRLSVVASVIASIVCAFAMGCSASSSGASSGGASQDGGPGTATTGGAFTCPDIIECAAKCADTDAACSDACVSKGTPQAKDAVDKIVTCVNDNACADSACFQTKCPTQLEACISAKSPTGSAITGAAPTGKVPADLVGRWHSHDDFYEFFADGTVARVTEGKVGSCKSSKLEKGTAVAEGVNLTVYFTSYASTICDSPGAGNPNYKPNSVGFTYVVEPSTVGIRLVLASKECSYTDPAAARFYCSTSYDKE